MTNNPVEGKSLVVWAIAITAGISLGNNALILALAGTEQMLQLVVRFSLTILLLYFLYRGAPLARWLTILLIGITAIYAIYQVTFGSVEVTTIGGLWMLAMGIGYLVAAGLLLIPTSVRAFFNRVTD